ncbi:hypothetical protein GOODEAATRI_002972, partial [Goodea atripinnis]
VLPSPSPSLYREATHLFADFSRLKPGDFRVDIAEATAQGVSCLKPEYIADYLMQVIMLGPGVESSSFFIIASLHPPVRDNYLKGFKPAVSFYHDPPIREETAAVLIKILCPSTLPEKSSCWWVAPAHRATADRCFITGGGRGGKGGLLLHVRVYLWRQHRERKGGFTCPGVRRGEAPCACSPSGPGYPHSDSVRGSAGFSFKRLLSAGTGNMCAWMV